MNQDTENQANQGRMVKIFADQTRKSVVLSVLCSAFVFILLIYFVAAFAVPQSFLNEKGIDCSDKKEVFRGFCSDLKIDQFAEWSAFVGDMSSLNQFLIISGEAYRGDQADNDSFSFELTYQVRIQGLDAEEKLVEESDSLHKHKVDITCREGYKYCDIVVFFFFPQIRESAYNISIEIVIDQKFKSEIEGITFYSTKFNPDYTNFLLCLRYSCLGVSVIFFIFYLMFFVNIPKRLRTFEHKYIFWLMVLLVLFNDPLYAVTVLKASPFWGILSVLFVVLYVVVLVVFWVITFQRIHSEALRLSTQHCNI